MKLMHVMLAAMALALSGTAQAQQFNALNDIVGGSPYIGAGTVGLDTAGTVNDGGRDAFDSFGGYENLGALTFTRQTEQLGNTYRFFDTFTNSTAASVSQLVRFMGDLGSDAATTFPTQTPGISVTCQGACTSDPVVAVIYSNNGMGTISFGPGRNGGGAERLSVDFLLTIGAGQSASLANFAFLASEQNGTAPSDLVLANATAASLFANPDFSGLTSQQIAGIVNFGAGQSGAVPEPATWAMMVLGFGAVGGALRSRRRTAALA